MSDQDNGQVSTIKCPTTNDEDAWISYWKAQGRPWRTEPEIDAESQKYLAERRAIVPDIEKGIYPFKDIKLTRADVEWLLATHESGGTFGPVDWSDESQREREGLDLRGGNLRQANLSGLPLARMKGGLIDERFVKPEGQRKMAAVLLQGANLTGAQLQGANLNFANLNEANLIGALLQGANLTEVQLKEANLEQAQLQGANLSLAKLQGANLREAQLDSVRLHSAYLSDERYGTVLLADIRWGEINLAVIDWKHVTKLGDEQAAQQEKYDVLRVIEYKVAVRAYRQLSVVLHNQGLNEDAARFVYRAQLMQRKVFWHQTVENFEDFSISQGLRSFGQYLFSLFLDLLAGYGYKPVRSFVAYLLVIFAFAVTYFLIGRTVGPALSPLGAFVFSMTSFHGRGFFPGGIGLDDPLTVVAALEAFVGLLIEVTFIATLTQRLFGK